MTSMVDRSEKQVPEQKKLEILKETRRSLGWTTHRGNIIIKTWIILSCFFVVSLFVPQKANTNEIREQLIPVEMF